MLNQNILILIAFVIYVIFLIRNILKKKSPTRIFVLSAVYFYVVAVLCIVFFPIPYQQNLLTVLKRDPHQPHNNIIPFYDIYQIVSHDTLRDIAKQIGGNIFMLSPFGFLLPFVIPLARFSKVIVLGVLFSCFIEISQLILDTFIGYNFRTSDIDDVICNTIGVIVGYALYNLADKLLDITSYVNGSNKPKSDVVY